MISQLNPTNRADVQGQFTDDLQAVFVADGRAKIVEVFDSRISLLLII